MSRTPIADSEHLQEGSESPEVPVNTMVDAVERMYGATREWTIAGDVNATKAQMAEGFTHSLGGSPAAAFAFGIPATPRRFEIVNDTGQTCTVFIQGSSGAGVDVSDGETVTLRSDGVNVTEVSGAGGGGGGGSLITRVALNGLSTYTFSAIDQGYKNLRFRLVGRTSVVALSGDPFLRVNGLSTAIYHFQRMISQSTPTPSGDQGLDGTSLSPMDIPGTTALAGVVGMWNLEILDYTGLSGLTKVGNFIGRQPNSTTTWNAYVIYGNLAINLTAAITSLEIALPSGAFTAGSYAELELT